MVKLYLARAMSGRLANKVVNEAKKEKQFFERAGFVVLDPVSEEGVKSTKHQIRTSHSDLVKFWERDKDLIREAHVVVDMTPLSKSEGVAHEIGYARYFLQKPIVRVYPRGYMPDEGSVAYLEDDHITDEIEEAALTIYVRWGTLLKRLNWRLSIQRRCFFRQLWHRIHEWK
jgi:hypothetical protein